MYSGICVSGMIDLFVTPETTGAVSALFRQ